MAFDQNALVPSKISIDSNQTRTACSDYWRHICYKNENIFNSKGRTSWQALRTKREEWVTGIFFHPSPHLPQKLAGRQATLTKTAFNFKRLNNKIIIIRRQSLLKILDQWSQGHHLPKYWLACLHPVQVMIRTLFQYIRTGNPL